MAGARQPATDILVVGGGMVGASIAYHLAGARVGTVTLCEQGRFPGEGATTRSAGLLRLHHTSHGQTRLAARSLPTYQHWPETVGGTCGYRPVGFLMLVAPGRAGNLAANSRVVGQCGGTSQLLTPAELTALCPDLRVEGVAAAAYEPAGGYAAPRLATAALVHAARRRGARTLEGIRVTAVVIAGDRVVGVDSNVGRIATGMVVLANGGWAARLGDTAGVTIPVAARRIGLARVELPPPRPDAPPVPAGIDDTTGCYFRPDGRGLYFGVPSHPAVTPGREVDPLRPDELTAAQTAVATRIPAAAGLPVVGTRVGFDGYTPDKQPIIGPAGPAGLYLATGFSGGGFKTAPAVGELVAAEIAAGTAATDRGTGQPLLRPYRPDRFTAGQLIDLDFPYVHS